MNWKNVRLIFGREVRDQLRDRRTLFMIAVLPVFLYPLLGMSVFQVSQFVREQAGRVLVVGLPEVEGLPPLVEGDRFSGLLFDGEDRQRLLELKFEKRIGDAAEQERQLRPRLREGQYEAIVYFPPDFDRRLAEFRRSLSNRRGAAGEVPAPEIYHDSAKEKSQVTFLRTREVLERWMESIGRQNLVASRLPAAAARPFEVATRDVASVGTSKAAIWSKILPFAVLIWSLTGAFYPAIDLCAGEKERGTLETLLSSPAERSEIVWGKLLTVMLFSLTTAVLNLASMGVTSLLILRQIPNFGLPPAISFLWLFLALVPVSALFSAVCLSLAAFARSTKEGQYYLMPVLLVTMPLTILPMAPGVELNLGNSLIPITGVMLLLRTLLEGSYMTALPYVPIVAGVTLACCLFAVRWAADQFNSEAVLFRESERFDLGLWFRHLLRDCEPTPTVAAAVFCGLLILMVRFFMGFAMPVPETFRDFAMAVAVTQLAVIATPALIMTLMLTSSPKQTLRLGRPPLVGSAAAVVLAVAMHPLVHALQMAVTYLYPVSDTLAKELSKLVTRSDSLGLSILLIAVLPAFCEELAFRGFVLSGLRHVGHKWRAIVISSLFFAVTHAVFQQSIVSFLAGLVIGYVAVQTGSIVPCILFHMVHNSMALISSKVGTELNLPEGLKWLAAPGEGGGLTYPWTTLGLSLVVTGLILRWMHDLPYERSAEETLEESIEQQAVTPQMTHA